MAKAAYWTVTDVDDDTVLHRDVEITADKHLLAAVVLIVDRLLT